MFRTLMAAAAASLLIGAAPAPNVAPSGVGYTVDIINLRGAALPVVQVEMRFAGDADGETRIVLPAEFGGTEAAWRYLFNFTAKGATVREDGPGVRVLRHAPGAPVTVRYAIQSAYAADPAGADGNPYRGPIIRPDWAALLGEFVFAAPEGRGALPATVDFGKLPKGWRAVSDLDHAAAGRPLSVTDVAESIVLAGPNLETVDKPISGGTLRVAAPPGADAKVVQTIAEQSAAVISAERGFWNDLQGPYLVAYLPLTAKPSGYSVGGTGRGDGFVLYATRGAEDRLQGVIAHEHTHTWIPNRVGRMPPEAEEAGVYWLSEGFTDFYTWRSLLRAGQLPAADMVDRIDAALDGYEASAVRTASNARIASGFWTDPALQQLAYERGALLALKWDEDIRLKTGGKADLNSVVRQMRDHYQKFAPGQGPDLVTGLVSAAYVVAGLDLRPDIDRYAVRGELIPLAEEMFGGCLYIRTNRRPTLDAGLDVSSSQAAKALRGVRRNGPAWLAGLRDGQRFDRLTVPTDTQKQVEVVVRDARGRAKTVLYWPYGDAFAETHDLRLKPGMKPDEAVACGKRLGGL